MRCITLEISVDSGGNTQFLLLEAKLLFGECLSFSSRAVNYSMGLQKLHELPGNSADVFNALR